jgi:CDP-diacylglycerol--glycerol-3-phosphate 3-phosphatidyltransferase
MLSRKYKRTFGELVKPLSLALHRHGFTAIHVTLAGLAFSVVAAFAYGGGYFFAGGVLLAAAGLSDALDGSVARSTGGETTFGAFIDSVADRYSELLTLSGIAFHYAATSVLPVVLLSLIGSMMVSYTRAKAESVTGTCDVGLMERPERLILLVAGSLFGFMVPALWALAILTNLPAAHRIYHTWKMVQGGR